MLTTQQKSGARIQTSHQNEISFKWKTRKSWSRKRRVIAKAEWTRDES